MSVEYDLYLEQHKRNVRKGFEWLKENLPDVLDIQYASDLEHQICFAHDASKTEPDEYDAYDAYFYGPTKSYEVVEQFNYAWLRHIHRNPHHWQYWVLINDGPMTMPVNYIIEMICDWWTFSWKSGDLYEIFNWYADHKDRMQLNDITKGYVEYILKQIKDKLDKLHELEAV